MNTRGNPRPGMFSFSFRLADAAGDPAVGRGPDDFAVHLFQEGARVAAAVGVGELAEGVYRVFGEAPGRGLYHLVVRAARDGDFVDGLVRAATFDFVVA